MTNPAFRKTKRSLPIALLRAREQVMEPIRAMLADSGVTEQKWRVLRVLEEAGEIEPTVIAREACLHLQQTTWRRTRCMLRLSSSLSSRRLSSSLASINETVKFAKAGARREAREHRSGPASPSR